MNYNWRSGGTRVATYDVDARRMTSTDGSRWATGRNMKRRLADKRFDVVQVWTLKARLDGRAVTIVHRCDKLAADAWVSRNQCTQCGEPEDGGQFGWFDAVEGLYCNRCGKHLNQHGKTLRRA
jgi:hypothetical protein